MVKEKAGSSLGPPPDPVAVLRGHRTAISAIAFHSTNLLISGDSQGELRIWDVNRRRTLASSQVHCPNAGVFGIASGWHENEVLSQGREGTVKCWQLLESRLSREPLVTISTNGYHFCKLSPMITSTAPAVAELDQQQEQQASEEIRYAQAAPQGKRLVAIAGKDPAVVEVWDIGTAQCVQKLHKPSGQDPSGMCMALKLFVPPGIDGLPNVLAGYEDGSMSLWDLRNTKAPRISSRFHTEPVTSVALDASCQRGISGAADHKTVFFSIDFNQDKFIVRKEITLGYHGIGGISIRQDSRIAATGGWDNRVRIYDYSRARPLAILKYHSAPISSVCFSDHSGLLASAAESIALWSIYNTK